MNNIQRGIIAGFVATAALSVLMVLKGMMGLMPGLNVIAMLGKMAQGMMGMGGPAVGWTLHFLIGAVLYGILFDKFNDRLPGGTPVIKGVVFGIIAWLVMMVAIMPMAGAGMFGMGLGMMAPVMTLMLHLIYGAVLGYWYGRSGSGTAEQSAD